MTARSSSGPAEIAAPASRADSGLIFGGGLESPLCACPLFPNLTPVHRESIKSAARIVVKLGTGVLTDSRKLIDPAQLEQLVAQVATLRRAGREVVLVTSGAVGAGMGALGYESRPAHLAEKQACAAVGQSRLMAAYDKLFSAHGLLVAQVLLTHDDLEHHERHLNARNTLVTLLGRGVVPIINENDAIADEEIKVGDNDRLSAHVAALVGADLLVILSGIDGLMTKSDGTGTLIPSVRKIDDSVRALAGGAGSERNVGGMVTKLQAAEIAAEGKVDTIIASGRRPDILLELAAGKKIGTRFSLRK